MASSARSPLSPAQDRIAPGLSGSCRRPQSLQWSYIGPLCVWMQFDDRKTRYVIAGLLRTQPKSMGSGNVPVVDCLCICPWPEAHWTRSLSEEPVRVPVSIEHRTDLRIQPDV